MIWELYALWINLLQRGPLPKFTVQMWEDNRIAKAVFGEK